jgi:hypothetical protein
MAALLSVFVFVVWIVGNRDVVPFLGEAPPEPSQTVYSSVILVPNVDNKVPIAAGTDVGNDDIASPESMWFAGFRDNGISLWVNINRAVWAVLHARSIGVAPKADFVTTIKKFSARFADIDAGETDVERLIHRTEPLQLNRADANFGSVTRQEFVAGEFDRGGELRELPLSGAREPYCEPRDKARRDCADYSRHHCSVVANPAKNASDATHEKSPLILAAVIGTMVGLGILLLVAANRWVDRQSLGLFLIVIFVSSPLAKRAVALAAETPSRFAVLLKAVPVVDDPIEKRELAAPLL